MKRSKTQRSHAQGPQDLDRYHAESRQRVADLAAKGQGHVALAESLALLGIDVNSKERPKLVGFGASVGIAGKSGPLKRTAQSARSATRPA